MVGTSRSRTLSVVLLTSFPAGPLQANCYVVSRGPGTGCALVDPGMDAMDGVHAVVGEHNLTPQAVLVTHGHFDHMWCVQDVAREYDCPVWIHPADRHLLADPMAAISGESAAMLRMQVGMADVPEFAEPDDVRDAVDGAQIEVDGLTFTVDHVPGHTPGTVVYRIAYDGPEDVSRADVLRRLPVRRLDRPHRPHRRVAPADAGEPARSRAAAGRRHRRAARVTARRRRSAASAPPTRSCAELEQV